MATRALFLTLMQKEVAMTRKKANDIRATRSMRVVSSHDEEETVGQVLRRPSGYYWALLEGKEFGPYPSYEEALADMMAADGESPEPGESLHEAESELGIADWIDPETGDPAEGWSRPHLGD
jgi:hypothetical protein